MDPASQSSASGTTLFLPVWPRVCRARNPGWTSPSLSSSPRLFEEPDGPLKTTTSPTRRGGSEEHQLGQHPMNAPGEKSTFFLSQSLGGTFLGTESFV
ncbi:rCG39076 [Rattus norvegicus]|uniref:RCG39076 n=1 Tax=Rattus norvegicus TaxID=10116 RepID=A6JY60_RAT|nr:rCG39076 [Rattus norvegicus]